MVFLPLLVALTPPPAVVAEAPKPQPKPQPQSQPKPQPSTAPSQTSKPQGGNDQPDKHPSNNQTESSDSRLKQSVLDKIRRAGKK